MLQDVFMHVTNRVDFGHLVNADTFDTSRINSEIYQIFDNRWDWEQRYIHDNYTKNFDPNNTIAQVMVNISAHRLAYLIFPSPFRLGIIK
jgi:hypothetical protein